MKGIEKQKLLQSIVLFAFAYKGNTDHIDFEDNDAGIEIENLAFSLAEDMGFDINVHELFLSRATVLERCRLMLKELVLLLESEFAKQERLYISIIDCSEPNLAEYLFNNEERVDELKLEIWTESTMSSEQLIAISSLNLFEGVLTSEQQSFSVFRIK